jgi:hypothetical protein
MRNMTGAAKARVLSEIYRERSTAVERAGRSGREPLNRDADHDGGAGAAGVPDHAQGEAG